MLEVFDQLRNQTFGTGEHITQEMTDMLIDFSNKWICVSLKNPRTRQLCLDLQRHTCSKRYCLKCRTSCRFRYPRFPILETIIAVPASLKYPDEDVCNEKSANQNESDEEQSVPVAGVLDWGDVKRPITVQLPCDVHPSVHDLNPTFCGR